MPTKKQETEVSICTMLNRHVPEVIYISELTSEDPLTEPDLKRLCRDRPVAVSVAELNEIIVGFMIYEIDERKLTITHLAVLPQRQRQGIAKRLVSKLTTPTKLAKRRVEALIIDSNLQGHLFLSHIGFRAIEVIGEYYLFRFGG